MIIVLTGGGTGGHITPNLAVAAELKRLRPHIRIVFIGQKGDSLADLPAKHPAIDEVYTIPAGKFRRYHGEGIKQLFDIATQAQNVRDLGRTAAGLWHSFWLIRRLKPMAIFTRGGFVSVPVALGGALSGVPYITHDSDSTPSLANRLIARWAALHTVALPKELYPYPQDKTITVGVPVSDAYVPVTDALQRQYRAELGINLQAPVLFITGGGNGAAGLNDLIIKMVAQVLTQHPDLVVLHMAGRAHETALNDRYDTLVHGSQRGHIIVKGFTADMYRYSGAADVMIARGGATGIAEFAVQGKACIIIPAPQLIWQVHHARTLAAQQALIALDERDAERGSTLVDLVQDLLDHPEKRETLRKHLSALAVPDTAKQLAVLLLEQSR